MEVELESGMISTIAKKVPRSMKAYQQRMWFKPIQGNIQVAINFIYEESWRSHSARYEFVDIVPMQRGTLYV